MPASVSEHPVRNGRTRVCLFLEGTYPYVTGGVSAWVHELITELSGIDFLLYTISAEPDQKIRYTVPANVIGHKDLVITASGAGTPGRSFFRRKQTAILKSKISRRIALFHEPFEASSFDELETMIGSFPEGYNPYRDVVMGDATWDALVESYDKNNPMYPFADFFWAWKSSHEMLYRILADRPPEADIYHAVTTGYSGLAGAAVKIRDGKPFMLTEHGLYHKEREMEVRRVEYLKGYQRDLWNGVYRNLSRLAYRYADRIISLFEYNRRKQIELGASPGICSVIPNGIDVNRFDVVRKPREGFNVGLVGRVVPIKDITTFITMCRIISDRIPEARFYCIGPEDEDPAYFEECRKLVSSFRLQEKFTFTGRQNVLAYYEFLDVLLLTSVREAQPLVILEGFIARIPAVATKVGNIPELLDYDERFLAYPKDAEKLADGVEYIYRNRDEVRELVEKFRNKVLLFYDRKTVHEQYLELYESYAGRSVWRG